MNEVTIRLQHHRDGLLEVLARLVQRGSLSVGSWQFLDEGDVPFGHLLEHGRELKRHGPMIRACVRPNKRLHPAASALTMTAAGEPQRYAVIIGNRLEVYDYRRRVPQS